MLVREGEGGVNEGDVSKGVLLVREDAFSVKMW